ncbi:hypothetical protein H8356DRAFT_1432847 [Neocallimastix lanati (nom. inval.)]|nr:hypothetical protein H8356DRAFT_1432847 [Neocallimastix sp. JGI-2020a]
MVKHSCCKIRSCSSFDDEAHRIKWGIENVFHISLAYHETILICLREKPEAILSSPLKEILKYESLPNNLEKEFDVSIAIVKYKIKDEIRKRSIPLGIRPKLRNENLMIFKNPNLIILQSPFQAKLFMKYNKDIFADSIFNAAEKIFPDINIKYCICLRLYNVLFSTQ